jgi:hypothetical protein
MTQLGKILVFINLVLSVVMAGWAGMLYAQRVDWSSPAKGTDAGGVVPRLNASALQLWGQVSAAETAWKADRKELADRERLRPENKAWYAKQVLEPERGQGTIKVLVYDLEGDVIVDPTDKTRLLVRGPQGVTPLLRRTVVELGDRKDAEPKEKEPDRRDRTRITPLLPGAQLFDPADNKKIAFDDFKDENKRIARLRVVSPYPLPDANARNSRRPLLLEDGKDPNGQPLKSLDYYRKRYLDTAMLIAEEMKKIQASIGDNAQLTSKLISRPDKGEKGYRDRLEDLKVQLAQVEEEAKNLQELDTNARTDVERLQKRNRQLRSWVEELKGSGG